MSAVANINSLESEGLRQAELCPRHTMKMNTKNTLIPDRSQPGITMTAPTVRHRDVGDKYAIGVPKFDCCEFICGAPMTVQGYGIE